MLCIDINVDVTDVYNMYTYIYIYVYINICIHMDRTVYDTVYCIWDCKGLYVGLYERLVEYRRSFTQLVPHSPKFGV